MKKIITVLCLFCLFTVLGCGASYQEDYSHYPQANFVIAVFMNRITGYRPQKQVLYPLSWCIVFQKVPKGYLLTDDSMPVEDPLLLETNEEIQEGKSLYGRWAYYIGEFQYTSISGFNKQIHAFRLVPRR